MKKISLILLAFLSLLSFSIPQSSAQCVVDTLVPRVPGIYPDSLPPFVGCNYGELDVTFVFPRDTVVEVAGQTVTVPFNSFTILGVAGLPQGMDWSCNLTPDCIYDLAPNNPNPDSIGCIQIFGTPNIPGIYPISVLLEVDVNLIGKVPASYPGLVEVLPCVFGGTCYTLSLSDNCEPAMLDLANNVPSGGNAGFSYQWEVNGPNFSYQTSDENPQPQMLNQAGTYTVDYELTVDTIGFLIDSIVINTVNCDDPVFNVEPDLYWILRDPANNTLVNTSGSPLSDFSAFPHNIGYPRTLLDTGTYILEVWDQDNLNPDDGCADGQNNGQAGVNFTNPPPQAGANVVTNNGLTVTFYVSNPQSIVSCSDTFQIDSLPAVPTLTVLGDTFVCAGDSVELLTATSDSVEWFFNGQLIAGANDTSLFVKNAGKYSLRAINPLTRCASPLATEVEITEVRILPPGISLNGTSFSIQNPDPSYMYEWFFNGTAVGSGDDFVANASGTYWAVAVDNQTGCRSDTSANVVITIASLDQLQGIVEGFRAFPNPVTDQLTVELDMRQAASVTLRLRDMVGKELFRESLRPGLGLQRKSLELSRYVAGVYLLEVEVNGVRINKKVIKK